MNNISFIIVSEYCGSCIFQSAYKSSLPICPTIGNSAIRCHNAQLVKAQAHIGQIVNKTIYSKCKLLSIKQVRK